MNVSISEWRMVMDAAMLEAAVRDPLDNYPREQDHFVKYAPASEVQAWVEWNRSEKEKLKNKFASSKAKTLRRYGECPYYISLLLESKDPLFFKNKKTRNSFFRRNPLFRIPEAI